MINLTVGKDPTDLLHIEASHQPGAMAGSLWAPQQVDLVQVEEVLQAP